MCAVDGYIIYSTCSLDPIGNEAVIASVLRKFGNSITLVDWRYKIGSLTSRSGLNWCLYYHNRLGKPYIDNNKKYVNIQSLYPPSENEKTWMHLDRCIRINPHDNNTGL